MDLLINITLTKGEEIILKEKVQAQNDNNILSFPLANMSNIIDINNQIFKRENEEYLFTLNFFEKKCILTLKNENYTLDIPVDKCNFSSNPNKITLEYFIETDDSNMYFEIEWDDN